MLRAFGVAFGLALTGAIAPGPVLILVVGQVLAQGVWAAVYIMLGHALLEALLILGLARGLKKLIGDFRIRMILGMIGGGVLIWMGWGLFGEGGELTVGGKSANVMSSLKLILAGIGVSLSNPYFTGWWVTVGTGQLAALNLSDWRGYAVFFIGHELGDMAWYLFVAIVVMAGRGWLLNGVYGIVIRVSAVAIIIFGGGFILCSLYQLVRKIREGVHIMF